VTQGRLSQLLLSRGLLRGGKGGEKERGKRRSGKGERNDGKGDEKGRGRAV